MNLHDLAHNTHRHGLDAFLERDPHLRRLQEQRLVHRSRLLDHLPQREPGIYTIGGGRQIGKTTLLKQWMADLLQTGADPACICYVTGELIDDHHTLVRVLTEVVEQMPAGQLGYVLLDEATYVRGWEWAIKYAADAGLLDQVVLLVTGSDLLVIQEARSRLPGRRGKADVVDFHLRPLSFREVLRLKGALTESQWASVTCEEGVVSPDLAGLLLREFDAYLVHGGFLTALNDVAREGRVLRSTLATYSDWIRGDLLKRGKQDRYVREVLSAIIKRYGSQVTWNSLARDLSIDHPATVAEYVSLLSSMDAVMVQAALLEDKLAAAPKKARKLAFRDPFIYHAVRSWLEPCNDPFADQIEPLFRHSEQTASLAEACAATQYARRYPTYYIKGEGEVDIAYIDEGTFWPVEVKWSRQLRPKSLKQISKYPNGRILASSATPDSINGVPVRLLPLALLRLDSES